MTITLADLQALFEPGLAGLFFVFLRVGAVMSMLPGFGEQSVPVRVRLALTLCFVAIVAPAVLGSVAIPSLQPGGLLRAGLAEVVVGLALGFIFRLMIMVLQIAGAIAANVTSLSQLFGGTSADPQPALGNLMVIGGIALAMILGLHVKVAMALIFSYDVFPVGQFPAASSYAGWASGEVAHAFSLAFALAAPFVIASFIYNLALGAINRAMPQLMVAFVGAPAITAGALILMFLSLPLLLSLWINAFDDVLGNPVGAR